MPSDPITYTCTCSASLPTTNPSYQSGLVLLFYRYFASPPSLPPSHYPLTPETLSNFHTFHESTCRDLGLTGKIRLAREGFNITVAGTTSSINSYISACLSHWSFAGLGLSLSTNGPNEHEQDIKDFFKPTSGCACVFEGLNVRVTEEITPLGVANYEPKDWNSVTYLSPKDFHEMITGDAEGEQGRERVLLDIRNHYESRIGFFSAPDEELQTVRPQIRRFSQFPAFVKRYLGDERKEKSVKAKTIFSYCTGGIRCEKATRWMMENVEAMEGDKIYTLKGGISAYMAWFEEEVKVGRRDWEECAWKGKEYVFDSRGSLALGDGGQGNREKVGRCHGCGKAEDRLGKCSMEGCELVLVVCEDCESVNCCKDCGDVDEKGKKVLCSCETERELGLWGPGGMKSVQIKKQKQKSKKSINTRNSIDIKVNIIH